MTSQAVLRRKVRDVLNLAPSRRFTEEMILDAVNELLPDKIDLNAIRDAIAWNQESGFVDYKHNREYERDEWFLTDRGKQLQQ